MSQGKDHTQEEDDLVRHTVYQAKKLTLEYWIPMTERDRDIPLVHDKQKTDYK